jgi:hypothetical protein
MGEFDKLESVRPGRIVLVDRGNRGIVRIGTHGWLLEAVANIIVHPKRCFRA